MLDVVKASILRDLVQNDQLNIAFRGPTEDQHIKRYNAQHIASEGTDLDAKALAQEKESSTPKFNNTSHGIGIN